MSTISPKSSQSQTKVPQWLPISLLAFSTAALAVPIYVLRRHRANALLNNLKNSAPPLRRAGASPMPHLGVSSIKEASASGRNIIVENTQIRTEFPAPGNGFNAAIYCAKAFGIATFLVSVGAVITVWGVQTGLGVRDTKEFAHWMRSTLLVNMPLLTARIHRPLDPSDGTTEDDIALQSPVPQPGDSDWNWLDAEGRMREGFDRSGFWGWAEAALREVEAEGRIERVKRGTETEQARQKIS